MSYENAENKQQRSKQSKACREKIKDTTPNEKRIKEAQVNSMSGKDKAMTPD